jgi:hypothetical protein
MGAPYATGERPVIKQVITNPGQLRINLIDPGSYISQEQEKASRFNVLWQREAGPVGSGRWENVGGYDIGLAIKRERTDKVLPGEVSRHEHGTDHLLLGDENRGRRIRVLVWGGVSGQWDGGINWTIWGNAANSRQNDEVSVAYSDPVQVVIGGNVPPPPQLPTVEDVIEDLNEALSEFRLTTLGYQKAKDANPNSFDQTHTGKAENLILAAIGKLEQL